MGELKKYNLTQSFAQLQADLNKIEEMPSPEQVATKAVNDLVFYYLKSETYTKGEVEQMISALVNGAFVPVAELPEASAATFGLKIYLVPSPNPAVENMKDEFITTRSGEEGAYTYAWEQIGSTAVDLSNYATIEAMNTALGNYVTNGTFYDTIANYSTTEQMNRAIAAVDKIVFVTYGTTTYQEIVDAYNAGKVVIALYGDREYILTDTNTLDSAWFLAGVGTQVRRLRCTNTNQWTNDFVNVEITSNKSQSIETDKTNTNKYPSAKAVADAIADGKQIFWATYGTTTASDVAAKVSAGVCVLCLKNNIVYSVTSLSSGDYITFGAIFGGSSYYLLLNKTDDTWQTGSNALENTSNKTGDIESNKTSTTKYPTTKGVADYGSLATLFGDFDHLVAVRTIEYDITKNEWCKLFERENPAGTIGSDVNEVVACRITTTGDNMDEPQVIDMLVMLPGRANRNPFGLFRAITPDVSNANKYGIYQLRTVHPKAIGNGYSWQVDIIPGYASRHIKVEIFKTSPTITFFSEHTKSSLNGTNQSTGSTQGAEGTKSFNTLENAVSGSALSAAYITSYLMPFFSTLVYTGEALLSGQLCFLGIDGKAYGVNNTTQAINPEGLVFIIGGDYAINKEIGAAYIRVISYTQLNATTNPNTTLPTFAKGDQLFLRCHIANGQLYSDAVITTVPSPGYTWMAIGYASSSAQLNLFTAGKEFLTLDANGRLTHVNGREIASPSLEAALFKRGIVSQTITWTGSNTTGYDHNVSNLVYGLVPLSSIQMFGEVGAIFNETTGYFELNEITDISYDEMTAIYSNSIGGFPFSINRNSQFNNYQKRTALTRFYPGYSTSINHMFVFASYLEVANMYGCNNLSSVTNTFQGCYRLRKIIGTLSAQSWSDNVFQNCASLAYLRIEKLRSNLFLGQSSHLDLESIVYIVDKATNTVAVTITLHADAYARCVADTTSYTYNEQTYTGILAYASARNITIASA